MGALDCTSGGVTGGGLGKLLIASASRDRSVRLWCAGTGECIACYEFHKSWVKDVLFHPNAPYILSCSDDCSIRVVDLKVSQQQQQQTRRIKSLFLCFGLVCVFRVFYSSFLSIWK